ncbi:hypothetical protein HK097_001106 [Rhizophlyctis rosea]|uniref:Uncharacterized protein n=1 Tax=Rhizophlyctis rosea TaxID=64517 RepID=A0AAD5S604_9FUNG|nr:hypothetical protein HK097_001106 [Rhizophlyctis rosea]
MKVVKNAAGKINAVEIWVDDEAAADEAVNPVKTPKCTAVGIHLEKKKRDADVQLDGPPDRLPIIRQDGDYIIRVGPRSTIPHDFKDPENSRKGTSRLSYHEYLFSDFEEARKFFKKPVYWKNGVKSFVLPDIIGMILPPDYYKKIRSLPMLQKTATHPSPTGEDDPSSKKPKTDSANGSASSSAQKIPSSPNAPPLTSSQSPSAPSDSTQPAPKKAAAFSSTSSPTTSKNPSTSKKPSASVEATRIASPSSHNSRNTPLKTPKNTNPRTSSTSPSPSSPPKSAPSLRSTITDPISGSAGAADNGNTEPVEDVPGDKKVMALAGGGDAEEVRYDSKGEEIEEGQWEEGEEVE